MTKSDSLLHITYDAADSALDELVQSRLFLTRGTGSTSRETSGRVTISVYFDSTADRDDAAKAMADLPVLLAASEAERLDWLALYQQSLQPIFIGNRFVVAPDAALIERGDRLSIVVPQEHAFGTGSHESTALCIEMLERVPLTGATGLDIGAGSGILAIAMHRLGAQRVVAFDNDTDAYAALRENRARNRIPAEELSLFIGGVDALGAVAFDVVTMNILPEVIVDLFPEVAARVGGDLIVSGILSTVRHDVVRAASNYGFGLVDEREKGEWWCGRFQRPAR